MIKHLHLPLTALCLLLCACGFEPMYGSTTKNSYGRPATEDRLAQIAIDNIPDAEGQYLRNALIDRFYRHGRPANTLYKLQIAPLKERHIDLDVTIESETTRGQIRLTTKMALISQETGQTLLQRDLRVFNSYNVLGSQFTTLVSEEDAREAALNDLARQIETQITLYFNRGL